MAEKLFSQDFVTYQKTAFPFVAKVKKGICAQYVKVLSHNSIKFTLPTADHFDDKNTPIIANRTDITVKELLGNVYRNYGDGYCSLLIFPNYDGTSRYFSGYIDYEVHFSDGSVITDRVWKLYAKGNHHVRESSYQETITNFQLIADMLTRRPTEFVAEVATLNVNDLQWLYEHIEKCEAEQKRRRKSIKRLNKHNSSSSNIVFRPNLCTPPSIDEDFFETLSFHDSCVPDDFLSCLFP